MISDDDLLLYHYGDGLAVDERNRIAAARLKSLAAQLDAAAAAPDVPVPTHVQHRWQASLAAAAQHEPVAKKTALSSLFGDFRWGTGAAAFAVVLLVTSVGLGVFSTISTQDQTPSPTPDRPTAVATNAADVSRYERGLQWHLAQTEQQLASLGTTSGVERSRLVDKVILQNRLYAVAADRADEQRLARVLRSFTPILESLADDRTGESEFAGGVAQLNFELKVMQARLATAATTNASSQTLAL